MNPSITRQSSRALIYTLDSKLDVLHETILLLIVELLHDGTDVGLLDARQRRLELVERQSLGIVVAIQRRVGQGGGDKRRHGDDDDEDRHLEIITGRSGAWR